MSAEARCHFSVISKCSQHSNYHVASILSSKTGAWILSDSLISATFVKFWLFSFTVYQYIAAYFDDSGSCGIDVYIVLAYSVVRLFKSCLYWVNHWPFSDASHSQVKCAVDKRVDHRVGHSEAENPAHAARVDATDRLRERVNHEHHLSPTKTSKQTALDRGSRSDRPLTQSCRHADTRSSAAPW